MNTVALSDMVVRNILQNPTVLEKFTELRGAALSLKNAPTAKGCKCKVRKVESSAISNARIVISMMTKERIDELKQTVGITAPIKILYMDNGKLLQKIL